MRNAIIAFSIFREANLDFKKLKAQRVRAACTRPGPIKERRLRQLVMLLHHTAISLELGRIASKCDITVLNESLMGSTPFGGARSLNDQRRENKSAKL